MPKDIDPDLLITLVQARPVLWDKTLAVHKDRFETTLAWNEVFTGLKSDFCELNEEKKKVFGKEVMKKWVNIRDAFNKSRRKEIEKSQSGNGDAVKQYIYADQLKFLKKILPHYSKEDSLSMSSANENSEHAESDEGDREWKPNMKPVNARKRQIHYNPPQPASEPRILTALQQPEDRHISFFKGIIPSLNTFTDDETIQFQMGVLQLITDIKQSRFRTHADS